MGIDLSNPSVLDARDFETDYIVYYGQEDRNVWHFERVSDGAVLHRGSLEEMLALIPQYPKSRRATWAEDTARWKPKTFAMEMSTLADTEALDTQIRPEDNG